jgi:hypothetical protein
MRSSSPPRRGWGGEVDSLSFGRPRGPFSEGVAAAARAEGRPGVAAAFQEERPSRARGSEHRRGSRAAPASGPQGTSRTEPVWPSLLRLPRKRPGGVGEPQRRLPLPLRPRPLPEGRRRAGGGRTLTPPGDARPGRELDAAPAPWRASPVVPSSPRPSSASRKPRQPARRPPSSAPGQTRSWRAHSAFRPIASASPERAAAPALRSDVRQPVSRERSPRP